MTAGDQTMNSGMVAPSPWRRRLVIGGAVLVCGSLLYVFGAAFGTDPHAVPFGMQGKQAPNFSIKRLDTGETVSLDMFKGRPVVLNFWATWCGPCAQEHPVLEWSYRQWSQDVVFLGIVFEDNEENTKKFLARNGGSWIQLFDPKSTVAVDYAVAGVPETYFINRAGTIVSKYPYPIDPETMKTRIAEITK